MGKNTGGGMLTYIHNIHISVPPYFLPPSLLSYLPYFPLCLLLSVSPVCGYRERESIHKKKARHWPACSDSVPTFESV